MKNVGTPYEQSEPAASVSGVRRARQQPRRVHAEHDRVARDRARVAAVGAADHLRAPSVGAVSDAHLAAAVLRAGRHRRAVPDVARSEHDRHGDREGARGARAGRRDAHGHRVRRLVSRLHRLRAEFQEHRGVLDRDGALSVRDAARVHAPATFRRTCATCVRAACTRARGRPGWWRLRDAVDYMETASLSVLEYAAKYKESLLLNRYKAGRDQIALGIEEARRSRTSSRRSSAIRSPRSSCCAASRSAACASRS